LFIGPTPKIKSGCDVTDILSAIKGFLRQGHLQVQVSSIKLIGLLSDGLRQEFGPMIRPLTQAIVMKCKEKRLVPELQSTLNSLIKHCLSKYTLRDGLVDEEYLNYTNST
jgi:hypothetical protein